MDNLKGDDGKVLSYATSKLDAKTQLFIKLLFDHETFKSAMANMEIGKYHGSFIYNESYLFFRSKLLM